MGELFRYKQDGEYIEVELSPAEVADILGERTALKIFNDKIESVLNDPDITDIEFARLFRAYFRLRLYGEVPDFSDDRFLRKAFEGLTDNDRFLDNKYIERVLTNRANGKKGGHPPKNTDEPKEEGDDP